MCVCDATGFALPLVVHMSLLQRGRGNLVKDHRGDVVEHINGQTLRGDLGGGNLFRREGAERMLDGVKADFSG